MTATPMGRRTRRPRTDPLPPQLRTYMGWVGARDGTRVWTPIRVFGNPTFVQQPQVKPKPARQQVGVLIDPETITGPGRVRA